MSRWLVFDTETTDLLPNSLITNQSPRIIEFCGMVIDDAGRVVEELEFICNPGFEINSETTKITGITPSMLDGKKTFKHYEGHVRSLINSCDAVVAHNLKYDYEVVSREMEKCGTFDRLKWPRIRICTVMESEWYMGYRLSLTNLYIHLFGDSFSGAHRARNDVEALVKCVVEMKRRGDL